MTAITRIRDSRLRPLSCYNTIVLFKECSKHQEEDAPAMHPSVLLLTILVILQTASSVPTNTTSSPLNFLGVNCYHLSPDERVTPHQCQRLFEYLCSSGDIYQKYNIHNGWIYKAPPPTKPEDTCIVRVASPDRQDRKVMLSFADIVRYSSDVLRECEMGGANTFEGKWSVIVTKNYMTGGWRSGGRVDVS
ncbi:MAG: hypothetical protein LQ343_005289 [Gyalolechia ehrenbergii]|nr:MAG: hypothetical protein LQ343_005289 [Gyalolechia ehrenbergii]